MCLMDLLKKMATNTKGKSQKYANQIYVAVLDEGADHIPAQCGVIEGNISMRIYVKGVSVSAVCGYNRVSFFHESIEDS